MIELKLYGHDPTFVVSYYGYTINTPTAPPSRWFNASINPLATGIPLALLGNPHHHLRKKPTKTGTSSQWELHQEVSCQHLTSCTQFTQWSKNLLQYRHFWARPPINISTSLDWSAVPQICSKILKVFGAKILACLMVISPLFSVKSPKTWW